MSPRHRKVFAAVVLLTLGACSTTVPVAVVGQRGETLKGTATTSMISGGDFEATDGRLTCTGSFDSSPRSPTVSVAVRCSDGRTGVGRAVRDTALAGSGKIQMNDGSTATFIFGSGAAALR